MVVHSAPLHVCSSESSFLASPAGHIKPLQVELAVQHSLFPQGFSKQVIPAAFDFLVYPVPQGKAPHVACGIQHSAEVQKVPVQSLDVGASVCNGSHDPKLAQVAWGIQQSSVVQVLPEHNADEEIRSIPLGHLNEPHLGFDAQHSEETQVAPLHSIELDFVVVPAGQDILAHVGLAEQHS